MEKYVKVSDVMLLIQKCWWWFTTIAFKHSLEWKINDLESINL